MALERKVYSKWAFTNNEFEKRDINYEIYKELCEKYKICRNPTKYDDFDDFDIVLSRTPGYAHSVYQVLKNNTELSENELALICDSGNLCFGYMMEDSKFHIFED